MRHALFGLLITACAACATEQSPRPAILAPHNAEAIEIPTSVVQGALLMGRLPRGSRLVYDGRPVRVAADGRFVIGVARERIDPIHLTIVPFNSEDALERIVAVVTRKFPLERINGVPEKTVNPPPEITARIEHEQAAVNAARMRDDDRTDFDVKFIWPVAGRISGVFGSQRIYNGTPKSPHSGLDVAAAQGTAIQAPAAGLVTFTDAALYLTGGTVVIDHGHGISSNFLHMSQIDVTFGERVEQGQIIGRVGATGRATGPHMHWGMNWFEVRVDPQLLVDADANPQ